MASRRRIRRLLAFAIAIVAVLGFALWTAPRWLVPRIAAFSPGCLYSVRTTERVVAFTFDDGPDSAHTDEILDVLKANDAHATFFFVSSHVPGNEALLTRLVAQGQEIGNHLTRVEPSIRLSPEAFDAAVREAGASLSRFGAVRWLRPGSTWYNARMLGTIQRAGYRCALGSVYPYDPQLRSAPIASAYILANVQPGAIIVLHERDARGPRTVTTLKRVLPVLRSRGYRIVTLSELARLQSSS
jgi:peptidoglycan/xylan/chitin deacetylase (PgdA/CDA1 family)